MIKNTVLLDLTTIDLAIANCDQIIRRVPDLSIAQDAKDAWIHEIQASKQRLQEMRPAYEDGSTSAKNYRDRVIMLMHLDLAQSFINVVTTGNRHGVVSNG